MPIYTNPEDHLVEPSFELDYDERSMTAEAICVGVIVDGRHFDDRARAITAMGDDWITAAEEAHAATITPEMVEEHFQDQWLHGREDFSAYDDAYYA